MMLLSYRGPAAASLFWFLIKKANFKYALSVVYAGLGHDAADNFVPLAMYSLF